MKPEIYDSITDLKNEDADLLQQARRITQTAYAPYSHFCVGAAAILNNGRIVKGTNQENASFPVGICAERSLLASAAALFPAAFIKTMAISYHNHNGNSNQPVSPCGMCRQALLEHEKRYQHPVRLLLSGMEGKVYLLEKSSLLLPLSFTVDDLLG
jgi:cytidine deaminase